eukprot:scaffold67020_cov25-Tisochrysis_lutea.AAC.1
MSRRTDQQRTSIKCKEQSSVSACKWSDDKSSFLEDSLVFPMFFILQCQHDCRSQMGTGLQTRSSVSMLTSRATELLFASPADVSHCMHFLEQFHYLKDLS